jgi:hypothetical protein
LDHSGTELDFEGAISGVIPCVTFARLLENFVGVHASILDGLSQADRDAAQNGWRMHKDSCESICLSGSICQFNVAKSQENTLRRPYVAA